jgi:uncharacterized protein YybS (DUF2232 family)
MLASCTALVYHFSATFRLESWLGSFYPLPIVLAAARWGAAAAWKTLVRMNAVVLYLWLTLKQLTTALLLLLLGGPLRAVTFVLLHGALSVLIVNQTPYWRFRLSGRLHWAALAPSGAVVT